VLDDHLAQHTRRISGDALTLADLAIAFMYAL